MSEVLTHPSIHLQQFEGPLDLLYSLIAKNDIDIFDINGTYYISEVNPRFGGGYPHAYECGVDHMKLILNNLNGIANQKNIGAYEKGIYMMKYNEVKIVKM